MNDELTGHVHAHVLSQVVVSVEGGSGAVVASKLVRQCSHHGANTSTFAPFGSLVHVKPNKHCVLEWKLDRPGLSSHLGVHFNHDLGSDGHQSLGGHVLGKKALTWDSRIHHHHRLDEIAHPF